MCNHENILCIKTTGNYWIYKCFDKDCGEEWIVEKKIKTIEELKMEAEFKKEVYEQSNKKSILERISDKLR